MRVSGKSCRVTARPTPFGHALLIRPSGTFSPVGRGRGEGVHQDKRVDRKNRCSIQPSPYSTGIRSISRLPARAIRSSTRQRLGLKVHLPKRRLPNWMLSCGRQTLRRSIGSAGCQEPGDNPAQDRQQDRGDRHATLRRADVARDGQALSGSDRRSGQLRRRLPLFCRDGPRRGRQGGRHNAGRLLPACAL